MSSTRVYSTKGLATAIATFREGSGVSRTELAERLGLDRQYVRSVETTDSNITLDRVFAILDELGYVVRIEPK